MPAPRAKAVSTARAAATPGKRCAAAYAPTPARTRLTAVRAARLVRPTCCVTRERASRRRPVAPLASPRAGGAASIFKPAPATAAPVMLFVRTRRRARPEPALAPIAELCVIPRASTRNRLTRIAALVPRCAAEVSIALPANAPAPRGKSSARGPASTR
jgi:hypothetical protein